MYTRKEMCTCHHIPANMRRWADAGLLLGQRRRRWANSKPALVQRPMIAGINVQKYDFVLY